MSSTVTEIAADEFRISRRVWRESGQEEWKSLEEESGHPSGESGENLVSLVDESGHPPDESGHPPSLGKREGESLEESGQEESGHPPALKL
jgi:hypothetical protein